MLCTGSLLAWAPQELGQLIPWAWAWRGCSSTTGHPSILADAFWQLAHRQVWAAALQACSSALAAPQQLLDLLRMCPSAVGK